MKRRVWDREKKRIIGIRERRGGGGEGVNTKNCADRGGSFNYRQDELPGLGIAGVEISGPR